MQKLVAIQLRTVCWSQGVHGLSEGLRAHTGASSGHEKARRGQRALSEVFRASRGGDGARPLGVSAAD